MFDLHAVRGAVDNTRSSLLGQVRAEAEISRVNSVQANSSCAQHGNVSHATRGVALRCTKKHGVRPFAVVPPARLMGICPGKLLVAITEYPLG